MNIRLEIAAYLLQADMQDILKTGGFHHYNPQKYLDIADKLITAELMSRPNVTIKDDRIKELNAHLNDLRRFRRSIEKLSYDNDEWIIEPEILREVKQEIQSLLDDDQSTLDLEDIETVLIALQNLNLIDLSYTFVEEEEHDAVVAYLQSDASAIEDEELRIQPGFVAGWIARARQIKSNKK